MDKAFESDIDPALVSAYMQSLYTVPALAQCLRIGQQHPALDRWLQQRRASCWGLVTAHNPRSVLLSPTENATRHAQLLAAVSQQGWFSLASESRSPEPDCHWPPEQGLLILQLSRATARSLGQAFEQYAVVWGAMGAAAELLWC